MRSPAPRMRIGAPDAAGLPAGSFPSKLARIERSSSAAASASEGANTNTPGTNGQGGEQESVSVEAACRQRVSGRSRRRRSTRVELFRLVRQCGHRCEWRLVEQYVDVARDEHVDVEEGGAPELDECKEEQLLECAT